jgi:mannose-6-phosphate isomerase
MNNRVEYSSRPLKLKSTRVWRTYWGGKLIENWHGIKDARDSDFPEEWVASVVKVRNPGREHIINEGLSEIDNTCNNPLTLKELIGRMFSDRNSGTYRLYIES